MTTRSTPAPQGGRSRLALAVLCFGFLLGAATAGAQAVRLEAPASGDLVLSQLPHVLDHVSIEPKLTTGLTTTFYFRVSTGRRKTVLGGADISLRYDLWEEAYLLTTRDGLGNKKTELQPANQLADWWSDLRVTVAAAAQMPWSHDADSEAQPKELQVS